MVKSFRSTMPPLILAAYDGDLKKVKELLNQGADIHQNVGGRTALHYAAQQGWYNIVELLIMSGADVNCRTYFKQTPLMHASDDRIINLLIQHKAEIDLQDYEGNTALHLAVLRFRIYSVSALLEAGADINIRNAYGKLPIEEEVIGGRSQEKKDQILEIFKQYQLSPKTR